MKIRKADGSVIEVAENYVLADGEALTVSTQFMDSGRSLVHDGHGGVAGQRPGFLYADTGADTAHVVRETLYREYANGIEQRWQSQRWQDQPSKPVTHVTGSPTGDGSQAALDAAHLKYRSDLENKWKQHG